MNSHRQRLQDQYTIQYVDKVLCEPSIFPYMQKLSLPKENLCEASILQQLHTSVTKINKTNTDVLSHSIEKPAPQNAKRLISDNVNLPNYPNIEIFSQ